MMPSVLKNTKRESILYGCVIVANAEIAMSTASIIFRFSLKEFARFNDEMCIRDRCYTFWLARHF